MPIVFEQKDFVSIYDNALSLEECGYIIDTFDGIEANEQEKVDLGAGFYNGELNRNDFCVFSSKHCPDIHQMVGAKLHDCLAMYCDHYFVARGVQASSVEVKLQRTPKRGGYHIWHCEQDSPKHADRVLVWTIYLNDIPYNEGETEFLWQGIRVNPKAGRCAIWPAAFTHTHRGNPVYTHDKYIATGWYTLI
jgi:hypothetical protein